MNRELIEKVRDAIAVEDSQFSQDSYIYLRHAYGRGCHSPSCIAGWAVFLRDGVLRDADINGMAKDYLGLDGQLTAHLFAQNWPFRLREGAAVKYYSPGREDAVAVLERLLAGETPDPTTILRPADAELDR